jgi:hypothetical protein
VSSPSFPPARFFDIDNASNYVHAGGAGSILGAAGYDSTFGNVVILHDGTRAGSALKVRGALSLVSGKLALGPHNLVAASVNVSSPDDYVVTDGSGILEMPTVRSTQKIFPVGTVSEYAPVWITDFAPADTFAVGVKQDSTPAPEVMGRVMLRWNVTELASGASNCRLQFGWKSSAEDAAFSTNRTADSRIFLAADSGYSEAGSGNYAVQLSSQPFTVTRSGITQLGNFVVGNFSVAPVLEMHEVPAVFELDQNYPNPFNPSTNITFSVDRTAKATLDVFNLLGQKALTLFDDVAQSGTFYKVTLRAGNLSTGVYFYRLQSGTTSETKKLILLR